jgi:hypothetical protein
MKGWRIDRGYVFLFEPTHPNAHRDGYVAEHTKVMAEILGRPLERYEEVHHKMGPAATTGQTTSSYGPVVCNRLEVG